MNIVFKTHDALEEAVKSALADKCSELTNDGEFVLSAGQEEYLIEFEDDVRAFLKQFIRHGECITLNIDIENHTVKVAGT